MTNDPAAQTATLNARKEAMAKSATARRHIDLLTDRLLASDEDNRIVVEALTWLQENGYTLAQITESLRHKADVQALKNRFPWLVAQVPSFDADWRVALEDALTRIGAKPLPASFTLTAIYDKYNSLRIDWEGADALEDDIQAIALELEDRTQGELPAS